jgi:hypothetical protein
MEQVEGNKEAAVAGNEVIKTAEDVKWKLPN